MEIALLRRSGWKPLDVPMENRHHIRRQRDPESRRVLRRLPDLITARLLSPRQHDVLVRTSHVALNAYRLMPSLAILDSRVCRGIPSLAAAPRAPEIGPWHSVSATSMSSRSRSTSARGQRNDGVERARRFSLQPCLVDDGVVSRNPIARNVGHSRDLPTGDDGLYRRDPGT